MKRAYIILLTVLLCLSALTGCGEDFYAGTDGTAASSDAENTPGEAPERFTRYPHFADGKVELSLLSDEHLTGKYPLWHCSTQTYAAEEAKIKALFDVLDRQSWLTVPDGFTQAARDARVNVTVSPAGTGTAYTLPAAYTVDFTQGTVRLSYPATGSNANDRYCTLSAQDAEAVYDVFYYYFSEHLE